MNKYPGAILALAAACAVSSAAAAPASGSVRMSGDDWRVADAIAYTDDDETLVVLGSAAFDRKAYAQDGKLDIFDFMRQSNLQTLTLKVKADGTMSCVNFSGKRGGGSNCGSIGEGLKLGARSATRIAGTFKHADDEDQVDVTFDLPVGDGKLARAGQPLPAGGGEPGAALMATLKAIESGDMAKIKAVSDPERVKDMEESEKSGEAKDMLEMMQMMTPKVTKISGGIVDGDTAVLDFVGTDDGQPVKGTATMNRIGGKWYMDGISSSGN